MDKNSFHCTICRSQESVNEFTVTRADKYAAHASNAGREPARYSECARCGAMIFQGSGDFAESYTDGFYYSVDGDPAQFLAQRFQTVVNLPPERSDNIQRVRRIKDFVQQYGMKSPAPHRVLDVGAGMGVFLHAFLDSNWNGVAVEPDKYCVAHMRNVLPNATVLQGYSSDVRHPHRYNLITLNRVLEHIQNPLPVLRAEADRLEEKGLLYIEVPDVWSFSYDGNNNEAFGYGHFIVYSPAALEFVASEAGFELLHVNRVVEPSTKFTLYAFFRKKGAGPRLQS